MRSRLVPVLLCPLLIAGVASAEALPSVRGSAPLTAQLLLRAGGRAVVQVRSACPVRASVRLAYGAAADSPARIVLVARRHMSAVGFAVAGRTPPLEAHVTARVLAGGGHGCAARRGRLLSARARLADTTAQVPQGPAAPATSPVPRSGSRLAWAPPALANPTVIDVTSAHHQLILDDRRDYVVRLPAQPLSVAYGLSIAGGRNVVIIGGEIDIPYQGQSTPPGAARVALYLKDQTGTVHVEGVLFSGGDLSDSIDLDERLGATVQLENLRSQDNHARDELHFSDAHPDCLQSWGGPAVLRVDHFTCSTECQGFFLHPQQYDAQAANRSTDLRNVNVTAVPGRPGYPGPGYLLWQADPFAKSLDNVWILPNARKPWDTLWPAASSWPGVSWGEPPAGDFVPAGTVGGGYVSPGYVSS